MQTPFEQSLGVRIFDWLRELPKTHVVKNVPEFCSALGSFGGKRDNNQDLVASFQINLTSNLYDTLTVHALLDGMGGMREGAECARLALSAFMSSLVFNAHDDLEGIVKRAIWAANNAVYDKYHGKGGTTFSALIFSRNDAIAVHAGDSRIYQLLPKKILKQISTDDTVAFALERMNPNKNYHLEEHDSRNNQLLQYVGVGSDFEPHLNLLSASNSGYLLVSDGAYKTLNGTFERLLMNTASPEEAVERVLTISEWLGTDDNASAICIWPQDLYASKNREKRRSNIRIFSLLGDLELQGGLTPPKHEKPYIDTGESVKIKAEFYSPNLEPYEVAVPISIDSKETKKRSSRSSAKTKTKSKGKRSSRKKYQDEQLLPLEIKILDEK